MGRRGVWKIQFLGPGEHVKYMRLEPGDSQGEGRRAGQEGHDQLRALEREGRTEEHLFQNKRSEKRSRGR